MIVQIKEYKTHRGDNMGGNPDAPGVGIFMDGRVINTLAEPDNAEKVRMFVLDICRWADAIIVYRCTCQQKAD
jgi:hypothetical protein